MVTISNSNLPGYDSFTFGEFVRILTKEFNLPKEYSDAAEIYLCRRWTAEEIADKLTCDGIEIGKVNFLPLFSGKATKLYNEELNKSGEIEPKYFWLSFRAVRYPLGTTMKHSKEGAPDSLKAYVLIQPDLKSLEN